MEWWQIVLLTLLGMIADRARQRVHRLADGIGTDEKALGTNRCAAVAVEVHAGRCADAGRAVPLTARILLPVLVLYLALPIDIIPDFIPVIGQIDDIVVIVVGLALLIRLVPTKVFDQHISDLEPAIEIGPPGYPQLPE